MIGLFAFLGTQQCYCWFTFGSLPKRTARYFGMDDDDAGDDFADLTMNYGAIVFVAVVGLCSWSLTRHNGLQRAMRVSALLTFLCCVFRCLPCLLFPDSSSHRRSLLWMLHVGSILNAAVGALYQSAASRISAVWFPPESRTMATAVAYAGHARYSPASVSMLQVAT